MHCTDTANNRMRACGAIFRSAAPIWGTYWPRGGPLIATRHHGAGVGNQADAFEGESCRHEQAQGFGRLRYQQQCRQQAAQPQGRADEGGGGMPVVPEGSRRDAVELDKLIRPWPL